MEPKAEKVRRAAVAVIARVSDALIPEGEVRLFRDRQAVKDFEDLLRRVIQAPVAKEEAQPARRERTINLREHESLGLAVTPARAHVRADILADPDLCTDPEALLELGPAHRRHIRRGSRSSAQSDRVIVFACGNAIAER